MEDLSSSPEDLHFLQPELLITYQLEKSSPGIWDWHDAAAEVLQAQQKVLSNQYFAFTQSRRTHSDHCCLHGFSIFLWKQQQWVTTLRRLPLGKSEVFLQNGAHWLNLCCRAQLSRSIEFSVHSLKSLWEALGNLNNVRAPNTEPTPFVF